MDAQPGIRAVREPARAAVPSSPGAAPLALGPQRADLRTGLARIARATPSWTWALSLYLLAAMALVGPKLLANPATLCVCGGGSTDATIFMWSLAWWPHALLHGANPFVTHAIWAPGSANVAAGTTIPAAALALWPVTAAFGPVVSYNVLATLSPALAAFTAYLLCRRLCGREAPALVGGLLFGFSSYELGQLLGHAHVALVFLLPVVVHLAVRRIAGDLSARRFVAALALVLIVQALLSEEILFDAGLIGAAALLFAHRLAEPQLRPRIVAVAREGVTAAALAAVVLAPYIVTVLAQAQVARSGETYGLDALNLIVPTPLTWLGGGLFHSLSGSFELGSQLEAGGYIGLPLLLAFAAFSAGAWRRSRMSRLPALVFCLSVVLALGSSLHIAGVGGTPLPWSVLGLLPVFSDLVASRIVVFAELAVAVGVALWLAQQTPGSRRRWLLVAVGCAALAPNLGGGLWHSRPPNPAFFRTAEYRRYLEPGENVLVIPFASLGYSMLWQAETNFYFSQPGGYISDVIPTAASHSYAVQLLLEPSRATVTPSDAPAVASFLRASHVHHVVLAPGYEQRGWPRVLRLIAGAPRRVGGILLYTVG